jgi:hypothetical protein
MRMVLVLMEDRERLGDILGRCWWFFRAEREQRKKMHNYGQRKCLVRKLC